MLRSAHRNLLFGVRPHGHLREMRPKHSKLSIKIVDHVFDLSETCYTRHPSLSIDRHPLFLCSLLSFLTSILLPSEHEDDHDRESFRFLISSDFFDANLQENTTQGFCSLTTRLLSC